MQDKRSGAQLAAHKIRLAAIGPVASGIDYIVPIRTRVFPSGNAFDRVPLVPRSGGICRRGHDQALGGSANVNVQSAVVIPNGRRPSPVLIALTGRIIPRIQVQSPVNSRNDRPVDHVLGMQYRHAHEMV